MERKVRGDPGFTRDYRRYGRRPAERRSYKPFTGSYNEIGFRLISPSGLRPLECAHAGLRPTAGA